MSVYYALINRGFFSILLVISAFLIWRNKKREYLLQISEERYQNIIESSPEAIIIIKGREIRYINASGIELYEPESKGVIGNDCMDIFAPDDHELIISSIAKATEGAKIELSDLRIGYNDSRNHIANLWIGEIPWDGEYAVMMIIKKKSP